MHVFTYLSIQHADNVRPYILIVKLTNLKRTPKDDVLIVSPSSEEEKVKDVHGKSEKEK